MVAKKWKVADRDSGPEESLVRGLSCSRLLARLLLRRGVGDVPSARLFLEPKLSHLHDPFLLPGMDAATDRIVRAMRGKEKVAIFGDYDVDGVSSTCLLYDFFRFIDFPVSYRLPHRLLDGYGLRAEAVRELAADGVTLIITVDNGSSAREEVEVASELGVDVVITDHHHPPQHLPRAAAIVNPWLSGSIYPCKLLAGVGVTFKLVWALAQRLSRQRKLSEEFRSFLLDSLALVALGTISDVVPLLGENRIFAKFGLAALAQTRRPGLRYLVKAALRGREAARLDAGHVAFRMGPRINAAGRLGEAETALRLLLAPNEEEARRFGEILERENKRRQEIERGIHAAARGLIKESIDLERDRVIVLGAPGWHTGVIGIVAARIVEEFFRPTLLVSLGDGLSRGSARSIPGVHICEALSRCSEHLKSFGGHEMAAGVEMEASALMGLRRALNAAVDMEPGRMVPEVEVDDLVNLRQLTPEALDELSMLAPHGNGNPEPVFAAEDLEIVGQPRVLGDDGKHLAFHVRQEGTVLRAIAFGKGELFPAINRRGTHLSLLVAPQRSNWQGRSEIELNIRDLRLL